MAIYQSMQRVRFSSPDGYAKFKLIFGEVRNQLKTLPGFMHLTWWVHPQDPAWYNEISIWTSLEALTGLAHEHFPQECKRMGRQKRSHHGGHHHQF